MALSKLTYNSLNVTAAASKGIGFDSDPDALQADYTGGDMVFIKKLTASSDDTLSFVNGTSDVVFDSTYKEYVFTFKDIHPETNATWFSFQVDTGTNTSYNIACTSTWITAYHNEAGTAQSLGYNTSYDQAQGTGFQYITDRTGTDNDQCVAGVLRIFNPSSSTFVKHFIAESMCYEQSDYIAHVFAAGYFNTTTALTRVQFKMSSDAIDSGDICLYGIN
jgi:hypothetical protein